MTYPKIDIYTICYNEEAIVPFMINYWKHLKVNHVYVADNYSTDKSVELLSQYPDWITITKLETDNKLNDIVNIDYKNNCWKSSDADLCIVCDFDEAIFTEDIVSVYEEMCSCGIDAIQCFGVWCSSEKFPILETSDELLHTLPDMKFNYDKNMSKTAVIRPNKLNETNYFPGAHNLNAFTKTGSSANVADGRYFKNPVYLLHYKDLSLDYVIRKYRSSQARLSDLNKICRYGIHYNFSDEKIRNDFEMRMKTGVDSIEKLINK